MNKESIINTVCEDLEKEGLEIEKVYNFGELFRKDTEEIIVIIEMYAKMKKTKERFKIKYEVSVAQA